MNRVEVGDTAPDFALRNQHGETVRLSSYRGQRSVVLVFYPWAFSRVCTGELRALRDAWPRLREAGAEVLALSCDPLFSLRAFAEQDDLGFSLLSDFWPHGAVAAAYGVLDEATGAATRSTVVVDREGKVAWTVHHALADPRDVEAYLVEVGHLT